MIKKQQQRFYKAISKQLTTAKEDRKLTTSQIARLSEEQFNTILGAEKSKLFSAHHLWWIMDILKIDLNVLIRNAYEESLIKEDSNGEENTEGSSLEDFI